MRLRSESLPQIVLAGSGRISFEGTEKLVAQFLIEWARLIIERVEAHIGAATRSRQVLGGSHEPGAESLSAGAFVDPQLGDVEPAPTRVTEDAADDRVRGVASDKLYWLLSGWTEPGFIEGEQSANDARLVGRLDLVVESKVERSVLVRTLQESFSLSWDCH